MRVMKNIMILLILAAAIFDACKPSQETFATEENLISKRK